MAIKVTHQNGCKHALNRKELESIIKVLPIELENHVEQMTLYSATEEEAYLDYFPKNKLLGLFCGPKMKNKETMINEILIAVDLLSSTGDIPRKITKNKRNEILKASDSLRKDCMEMINVAI